MDDIEDADIQLQYRDPMVVNYDPIKEGTPSIWDMIFSHDMIFHRKGTIGLWTKHKNTAIIYSGEITEILPGLTPGIHKNEGQGGREKTGSLGDWFQTSWRRRLLSTLWKAISRKEHHSSQEEDVKSKEKGLHAVHKKPSATGTCGL